MTTVRLVPSTYSLSNTSYFSVSNASNCYTNVDSTTYATFQTTSSSTSSRYVYLKGFNFSAIPSDAIVSSVTVKVRGYESGANTSTSYAPRLCNNTSTITNVSAASENFGTSAKTITVPHGSLTWDKLVDYGSDLAIRLDARRSSRNTASYLYVYGAEIEVTYSLPVYHDVTVTNNTSATVSPTGTTSLLEGEDFVVSTSTLSGITVTDNGVDVTNQFEAHYPDTTASTDLGSFTLVSGGFNSGQSWFEGIVGHGADTSSMTTSNYYSSGSGTIAVFTYDVGITIPSNAEVTRLYARVSGHAESTSQGSEYMCAQLISGSTHLTEELNFKSVGTSNSIQTLEATTLPTVAQLAAMKLQCRLGYYGGAINGATVYVEYEVPGQAVDHYEYTIENVMADHAIVVTAGGSQPELYVKTNGSWTKIATAYKKVSGSWQQIAVDQAFDSQTNYVHGTI